MGKPLGMGSVEIKLKLYPCERQKRYFNLFADNGKDWETGFSQPLPPISQSPDLLSLQSLKHTFEEAIMNHLKQAGIASQGDFRDQERIQALLKLLEWPGPDKKSTEYMELDQFRERRVLPGPLDYEAAGQFQPKSAKQAVPGSPTHRSRQSQIQGQTKPIQVEQAPVQSQQTATTLEAKADIKLPNVGDTFTDEIIRITPKGDVVIRYKNLPAGRVYAFIPAENVGRKQYQVGNKAKCEVVKKYQEGDGWVLECKPASKVKR
jgi:hypothetical protein